MTNKSRYRGGRSAPGSLRRQCSGDPAWTMDTIPQFNADMVRRAVTEAGAGLLRAKPGAGNYDHDQDSITAEPVYPSKQAAAATTLYDRGVLLAVSPRRDSDAAMYARPATADEAARSGRAAALVLETPFQFQRLFPTPPDTETSFFSSQQEFAGDDDDDTAEKELAGDPTSVSASVNGKNDAASLSSSIARAVDRMTRVGAVTSDMSQSLLVADAALNKALGRAATHPITYGGVISEWMPPVPIEQTINALGGCNPTPHYAWRSDANFIRFAASLGHTFSHRAQLPQLDYQTVPTASGPVTMALCPKQFVTTDGVLVPTSSPYLAGGFLKKLARKIKKVVKKVAKVVKKIVKNPVFKAIAGVAKTVLSATPVGAAINVASKVAKGVVTAVKAAKAVKKGIQIAKGVKQAVSGAKSVVRELSNKKDAPESQQPEAVAAAAPGESSAPSTQTVAAATVPGASIGTATQVVAADAAAGQLVSGTSTAAGAGPTVESANGQGAGSSVGSPTINLGIPSVASASLAAAISRLQSSSKSLTTPLLVGDATQATAGVTSDLVRSAALAFYSSLMQQAVEVAQAYYPVLARDLSDKSWDGHPDVVARLATLLPSPNVMSRFIHLSRDTQPVSVIAHAVLPTLLANLARESARTVYAEVRGLVSVPDLDPTFATIPSPSAYAEYASALRQAYSHLPEAVRRVLDSLMDISVAAVSSAPPLMEFISAVINRAARTLEAPDSSLFVAVPAADGESPESKEFDAKSLAGDFPSFIGGPDSSARLSSSAATGESASQVGGAGVNASPLPEINTDVQSQTVVMGVPAVARGQALLAVVPILVRFLITAIKKVAPTVTRGIEQRTLPWAIERALAWLSRITGCDRSMLISILVTFTVDEAIQIIKSYVGSADGRGQAGSTPPAGPSSPVSPDASGTCRGDEAEALEIARELAAGGAVEDATLIDADGPTSSPASAQTWGDLAGDWRDGDDTVIITRNPIRP